MVRRIYTERIGAGAWAKVSGETVAYYHLYFFSRERGEIAHTYEFEAPNDAAAFHFASVWHEDAPMELWRDGEMLNWWDEPGSAEDSTDLEVLQEAL